MPNRFLLTLMVAFALLSGAAAQELPGTLSTARPPVAPAQAKHPPLLQAPTIVANTDLVNMVFSVQGRHGDFIPGLPQADFRVFEDGHPQTIEFFSQENQLPLTVGLLLDTSPSQGGILPEEQQVSDEFFRQVVTPKDLAFVIGFDVDVRLLQDLTSSHSMLSHSVDHAHIGGGDATGSIINPGTFPTSGPQGATHLWDALYLACHDELAHQVGRKAILVVTDGGEQGSSYTWQDALRAALDSNTIVYFILARDPRFGGYGSFGAGPGPGELEKIAKQTGGRTINAGNKLGPAYQRIQEELRSQYSLAYRSNNQARDGKFRSVKIELVGAAQKHDKVRARTGYWAPKH